MNWAIKGTLIALGGVGLGVGLVTLNKKAASSKNASSVPSNGGTVYISESKVKDAFSTLLSMQRGNK